VHVRRLPLLFILLGLVGVGLLLGEELGVFTPDDGAGRGDDYEDFGELVGDGAIDEEDGAGPGLMGNPNAAGPGGFSVGDGGEALDGSGADGTPTVVLEGGVPFKGKVLDAAGRPVAEAKITLARAGTVLTFMTDEDGAFDHGPQPGRWDLSVTAPGVGSLLRRRMMIDGANGEDLTFKLRKPGTLTLILLRGKEGVEGVALTMAAKGFTTDSGATFEAITDMDGRAVFKDVPGANYQITAQIPDGPTLLQSVGVWSDRTFPISIPGGVALTGKVTEGKDGPGIGAAIITVDVVPAKSKGGVILQTQITTESDGKFSAFVPAGRVRDLRVVADGYAPWPNPQNWRERRNAMKPLGAISKGKPATTNIELRSGASVRGKVTDEAGNGMPCDLRILGRRGQSVDAVAKEDGTYAVADLNPGRYQIAVVTPGLYPKETLVFNVKADEPTDYDFVLLGARRIEGVVVMATGEPALGARVWLVGGGAPVRSARRGGRALETFTNEQGRWALTDVPTDKSVTLRAALGSEEATPVGISFNRPVPASIKLTMAGTASVKVKVIDMMTHQPLQNVTLRLRPDGDPPGRTSRPARTNNRGEANLYRLIPGKWAFEAKLNYYLKYEPKIVRLEVGDDLVDVTIELDPGLVFGGVVLNAEGLALRNANVRVWGVDQDGKTVRRRAVSTNQRGEFRFTGYTRGSYFLDARLNNHKRAVLKGLPGGDDRLVLTLKRNVPRR